MTVGCVCVHSCASTFVETILNCRKSEDMLDIVISPHVLRKVRAPL